MDEGGLFNDFSTDNESNIDGMNIHEKHGCNGRSTYATRGIPADEELMVDWGTYCQDNWYELGICKQG